MLVPLLILPLAGCYHAIVETGRPASETVIEDKWASSFVHGLVPPDVVETASQCPNGVARVETQLSFLNMLVAALTFGIYTPMQITVTCAAGGSPEPAESTVEQRESATQALQAAVDHVAATRRPVLVRLRAD
jgi:hypothetical protein